MTPIQTSGPDPVELQRELHTELKISYLHLNTLFHFNAGNNYNEKKKTQNYFLSLGLSKVRGHFNLDTCGRKFGQHCSSDPKHQKNP